LKLVVGLGGRLPCGAPYDDSVAFRGLARVPRRIARHLSDAARACAAAAAELETMARAGAGAGGPTKAAAEAERLSHRAALASAHMLGGGVDRADVAAIARSLQLLAASFAETASALQDVDRREFSWSALTGIVRDAARELAAAIDRVDGPAGERDKHLDRADELYGEWRRAFRTLRTDVLSVGTEPMTALAGDITLRRLERTMTSCRAVARTVRSVAIKHA
jgi:hypothetical protein